MRALLLAALLGLPFALAPAPARADACTLIEPCLIATIATPTATFYVWSRANDGWFVYEESNGAPGLQPGGCSPYVPDDCDWQASRWSTDTPDTLVYGGFGL